MRHRFFLQKPFLGLFKSVSLTVLQITTSKPQTSELPTKAGNDPIPSRLCCPLRSGGSWAGSPVVSYLPEPSSHPPPDVVTRCPVRFHVPRTEPAPSRRLPGAGPVLPAESLPLGSPDQRINQELPFPLRSSARCDR